MLGSGGPPSSFPSLAEAVAACTESALTGDPMDESFYGDAIEYYTKCLNQTDRAAPARRNPAQAQALVRYSGGGRASSSSRPGARYPSYSTRVTTSASPLYAAPKSIKQPVDLGLLHARPSANSLQRTDSIRTSTRMAICKPERPAPPASKAVKTKLSDKDGDMVLLRLMNLNFS